MATEDLTVRWERPPPRPVLHVNASVEAAEARALLEAYASTSRPGPATDPPSSSSGTGRPSRTFSGSRTSSPWRAAWCRRFARPVIGAATRRCRGRGFHWESDRPKERIWRVADRDHVGARRCGPPGARARIATAQTQAAAPTKALARPLFAVLIVPALPARGLGAFLPQGRACPGRETGERALPPCGGGGLLDVSSGGASLPGSRHADLLIDRVLRGACPA
jgi:hypothetical protein